MAQRYSYLLCRLLHDVLTGSLEISSVSQSLGCYWVLYYSTYHLTNYEQYLETLNSAELHYLEVPSATVSYFRHPPHIELAVRFYLWNQNGHFPGLQTNISGYGDAQLDCSILEDCNEEVLNLLQQEDIVGVVSVLGEHGLRHLLGLRHTVGSVDILYPPKQLLVSQFQQLNNPKSRLTVGARALSKHCIRCKQNWVEMRGPEAVQNEYALSTLYRLLEHCVWINIHLLPHNIVCLEIRDEIGFGARWNLTDHFFRGFVEPFMVDGHEKGWIHNL